ncbi:hypothetical protein K8R42_04275 [bacterium]|nr:hypothetical protein [bacterium]
MKKIVLALGIFLLMGVGCTKFIGNTNSINEGNKSPTKNLNLSVEEFVKGAELIEQKELRIFFDDPNKDVKLFSVSFGKPMDCPSGCIYSSATGLKNGSKIGWLKVIGAVKQEKIIMYDFDDNDKYLYSDQFLIALKEKHSNVYQTVFLPNLAEDKDVPKDLLLKIANGLSSYIQPHLASQLLKNPVVQKDKEILNIIANLPVFQGDAYNIWRQKAQDLLNNL